LIIRLGVVWLKISNTKSS